MALDKNLHRNVMLEVLAALFKDKEISPYIGFKGGTAVYFIYELDRFSFDLDFDILDESKRKLIYEKVKNCKVKINFNKKNTKVMSKYEVKDFMGISMNVMVQEDIVANKMSAVHDRGENTNRDIFDLWFFLKKGWPINVKLLESRIGVSYKEFLLKTIKMLEKDVDRNFLENMGELLKDDKQKTWVKTKMREELLFLLRLALDNEERSEKEKL